MTAIIRKAEAGDAASLVHLAEAVGSEDEGWLIADGRWRSVSEERRYLKAIRRHSYSAVLVAESDDRIVGRLSIGRDTHPASEHVADVGLMVADNSLVLRIPRDLVAGAKGNVPQMRNGRNVVTKFEVEHGLLP